jgi:hypothetical protein
MLIGVSPSVIISSVVLPSVVAPRISPSLMIQSLHFSAWLASFGCRY